MCVVSMIGDQWRGNFPTMYPTFPEVSKLEFEALKKEVQELKKLLIAAKQFDEVTGQKDCEMEDKIKFIKEIADAVGVDLSEVFGNKAVKALDKKSIDS